MKGKQFDKKGGEAVSGQSLRLSQLDDAPGTTVSINGCEQQCLKKNRYRGRAPRYRF
jgi:hypothetical protein